MKVAKRWWKFLLLAIVVIFIGGWVYQLLAVRGIFAPSRPVSEATGSALLVGAPDHRIAGRVYLTGTPDPVAPPDASWSTSSIATSRPTSIQG